MTSAVDGGPVRARAGWAWPAVAGLLLLATLAPEPAYAQTGICGRTEVVRDALVAKISGVSDCALVTDAHLAAITDELDLQEQDPKITALAAGDFDGLTSLTTLDLSSNELTALPDGVFDELTSLTTLDLSSNELTSLPDGVFDELTSLTTLELRFNDLTSLPDGVFDKLTSLTSLYLTSNELTSLPDGVFDELTSLTSLHLNHSIELTSLPDRVFDELTSLTFLLLDSNGLTALRTGVFDELTSLRSLHLNHNNELTSLPDGVFDKLTSLTALFLNSNDLTSLPDGVFNELTSLTSLWLQGNPGAPFAPTAVALPDDGTIPLAGGTVTLDGSASGGAWGTNVTYSWVLTNPANGVTVTFDDNASAKPVVTIPALAENTELTFTLTVTVRAVDIPGISTATATATVTARANTAPDATDATVSTDEDTAYDFDASDFNFTDDDSGDTLASVKITSLLGSGKGSLTLDGSAVTADQVVSRADIDAAKLVYNPPANANGDDYASFGFKVSDGTNESASAYTMTIDVTAVNDAATGEPAISGTARVGSELTAAKGTIADVDGLTSVSYSYQWIRVDGTDETNITGATSSTYTLVAADQGKKVKVRLGFADDGGTGEARTSAAYPDGATVLPAPAVLISGADDLKTGEDGTTTTFQVQLAAAPTNEVTVTPSSSDTGEGTVSGALTFTTTAWNTARTVTVTGVDDADVDGEQTFSITFRVESTDPGYAGISVPAVSVTNADDESLALTLDTIAGDDTVNIAEKAAGFAISGATGSEGGVSVTVTVGTTELTATSASGGAWSVDVPAGASYLAGTSVAVRVSGSKTGYTAAGDVTRALAVDLAAPSATYTVPSSLRVGVAVGAMTPSTTDTDIASYGATGLPPGLGIESTTGAISGTPDTADANTADATVTVTDTAGNTDTVDITFPAVAKGDQTLTGFAYSPASVTYGDTAPAVTAPGGVRTTLSYSATPAAVCTVEASTGALTLVGVGDCVITATAASSDDYNQGTATYTVTVAAAGTLALTLDTIAGDDTVNIAEKAAGFAISGDTGSQGGVSVTVTVGTTDLTATSAAAGAWSVAVPANAAYLTGTSVAVTVSASKTGYTAPSDVARTLAVDLAAPSATYTAPSSLKVGVAVDAMTPSTTDTDIASYGATGLPPGLGIDTGTGVISGTPDTADANTASATVTVTDTAGNTVDVPIAFPAVAKGDQTLTGFAYSPTTVTYGDTAPAVTAPDGVQTTLSYSATPATVCTVDASTGALTPVGVGDCMITATAAGAADYNEATAEFTVTVAAAGALALTLDAIAGDDTVNIAEKAAGFAISGATGSEGGVSVTVTVGTTELTATSDSGGAWSVDVPANAAYLTGTSVAVTVSASKTGYTAPSDVTRALAVDLAAPSATYTAPSSLKVGVAVGAMTPSTTDTDIASYGATGLPPGLGIDTGTGVISGTPDTADANTADATVTVTDTAGNTATASIAFPAVAKGDQTLTGFAYSPASVTFGGAAPALTAPGGVQTTLSYSAAPAAVCTVDASTGALTLVGVGDCNITATAAGAANYNEATAAFTVTVQAAGALALTLDAIAGDDTVNIAEKAAGFAISGATGSEGGVSVTVTVGSTPLTATSDSGGAWSVDVPANAAYLTGTSVAVTVSASKTGYTSPSDVTRALAVDLTAPSATYTAPSSLKVGVAVGAMTPNTTDTDIASYGATGLPPGLGIDTGTGVISGTPDTADANTASATVTVTDTAGNTVDVPIAFPAVAKGDQTLTGFAYSPATVTYGDTAPAVTAPDGVQTTLSYSATPATVCTVDASTGALTLAGLGECAVTATAAGTANYNEATAAFTVTVQAAGALALTLDTIAGDDAVNIAEKAAGFAISGATGSEGGVSVTVTVGTTELTATSGAGGAWSVDVPANAAYITGTSVTVTVSASKTGYTAPSDVARALAVDLAAPSATYTAPSSLQVGVAIGAMTPSTTDTDIASYGATGLPPGLGIDSTTGAISGTPDTADANTAAATVTVTDTAGNTDTVDITFPAVAKGDQTLTGFAYSPASVTFGGAAPALTAPGGVQTTLSYSAAPATVCTVDASTGALTLVGVGDCNITATAAGAANYNEATAAFTVAVQAAGVLALNLDTIATDDTVNIAEKAAGFAISGATGSEGGVSVTVTVGGTPLTATSDSGGAWSVAVPANAAYLTGTSVAVTVSASKTGYTPPSDVTRALAVDLAAPSATYTAPSSLQVGVAVGAMTPSTTDTDIASYGATGLPPGLGIDSTTGAISGTPDTADANTTGATVTVTDTAGNTATASIAFPAVAKGDQTLTGFAYSPATVTYGDTAPAVTAPDGVQTTLSYSATPATVCTVDASTGALTLAGLGECVITATAAGAADYNEATAAFTVTVQAAGALALTLDTIAGDDTVNIAEKAAGFAIGGATGSEGGVSVTVTVGGTELTATSGAGGAWSVDVPANAAYLTGTSVTVTVSASKTGYTAPSDVTRALAVDLAAPSATYTAPSSLQVGVAIGAMTPSTTDTDIASYGATGLPSGLGIDSTTGAISGTPDTADANTASATVTVTDTAGNTDTVDITFPAVAKGDQTLTGFAYSPASVTFGGAAPALTAPGGVQTTLSYSAAPATVCAVDASTGALTLAGVGACNITATAAGAANYNEATAAFTVTVQAAGALALTLDTIAGDDTVNIAEKAAGFAISGATGSQGGVSVTVTVGTTELTATSASGGAWSVDVPADAAYIAGTSVAVTVSASKTGYTAPSDVTRALAVDLTAPSATYTAPSSLKVGVAVGAMTPSTTDTDIASYGATGLPPGLGIDSTTGAISGTPDTADANTTGATVTVTDTAGNTDTVDITFPAVAKGDQTLTGFAYSPATVTYGDTVPAVTAPGGVQTTLSYSATPATVCTVDASTGALTLAGLGECVITATAAGAANYNEATAAFTVTVQAAGALALTLDTIAGDDAVNIAEKAAGFAIGGATGSEGGVSVTVTVGGTELTATSGAGGAWSVDVPANAAYLTGTSVTVTVSASKTGYTAPSDVARALAVDLAAPSATYTAPSSLQVGVAIGAMTPSTTDTDIASYGATGLPSGLGIDTGTGVISGTPDTADANTARATVTVTDTAGNTATVSIAFPAVAKGDQTLTGFAYSSASVTFGGAAPAVTAPGGVQTTLSYSAAPATVCAVDASTGALTLVGVGDCNITATAAGAANYNEATAAFTVAVQAAGVLALNLDTIATDDTVNIAEKAAGFAISGATGSEGGVSVTVTVGGTPLTATSDSGGAWSVAVPANAAYLTGTSVAVTVSASKTGYTPPSDVTRALVVDLTAPSATYTAPSSLKVGVAVGAMTPSTTDTDIASYGATGLPSGLGIDTGTGVISGTPDTADANTASATVTVTDTAGNTVDVPIAFPAVAKGDQALTGFAYSPATVTYGDTAPAVTAPDGVQTALSYSATPSNVCTVDSSTGALTLEGAGSCAVTATAAPSDDYNRGTAIYTVTVAVDPEGFDIAVSAPAAVDEDAGTATVTYTLTTRQNSVPLIDVTMFYRQQREETATRGDDYALPPGDAFGAESVIFDRLPPSAFSPNAAGRAWVAQRSFTIGIVDDGEAENHETIVFTVEASKGESPRQTITIRDDDTYITSVVVANAPQSGDTYRLYETILFTVTFSESVRAWGPLRLEVGLDNPDGASGRTVEAVFSRLTKSQRPTADTPQIRVARHMHFEYKVKLFDRAVDGVRIGANALRLGPDARILNGEVGGGAMLDHAAVGPLSDRKVDGSADVPLIERIKVVSTPRLKSRGASKPDLYGEGENIRIEVRFDQPVHVEGEPTLALEVGDPCGSVCEARYESGSGTDTLVFAYLVLEVDIDSNGIEIPADPIEVVYGDSIRNDAGQEAHLSFDRKGMQSGHKVDGSRAAGPHLWVEDAEAHEADGEMEFTVRLEPRGLGIVTVDYATRDGSGDEGAVAGEDYTETRGTLRFNPLGRERTVTVPIIDDDEEDDGETFTLRLSNPQGALLWSADAKGTGTIRNSEPVAALSASFPASASASASHSGADDRPQAVVAFSEPVAAFGADTPSVSVTGGTVASVQPHAEDGLENAWVFFLVPDGGGDVTFALVADAACAAGGICTAGGKALTEVPAASTIPGPGDPEEGEDDHSHPELTHAHSYFDDGKGYYTEAHAQHTHPHHVHRDTAHARRPAGHVHHVGEDPDPSQSGPELATHGGVEHTHFCRDTEASCNIDDTFNLHADEHGLPVRVTHAHEDSEPGHRFGWEEYFEEAGSGPLLSVMGAEATEGDDGALGFTVRLDREPQSEVTVDYATAAGTATAGADYTATSGTLTFAPGETAKTVQVPVEDDEVRDDGETLTLRLSNASGAGIWSEGATATGTIHNREAEEGLPPLTASFEDMPGEHDGESAFTFRIAFSEPLSWMNGRRLREDVVAVSGGRATAASRVDRRRDLWQVTVEPDSPAELTVTLAAGAACDTPAAVCTSDGRALSETISATVAGPAEESSEVPLTASFEAVPGEHDGESAFRFRVAFSERIAISYRSLREDAFAVTGGRVTRGKRVDGRKDLFEITVEPDGAGDVAISLPADRDCEVSGAICTWGPPRKPLTNTPSATVAGPAEETGPAPLTASFSGLPETHDGGSAFGFRIAFSEAVAIAPEALGADGLRVSGGSVAEARRVDGRADLFEVSVRPGAGGDVTIVLPGGRECGAAGAVCTAGAPARRLANTARATVRGLVSLSVADARAREGEDATLDFAVTLDRASSATVTVDYATHNASAKAGEDYEARSGTLSFAPGETAKTVAVPVLDDAHDEGTEILVLRLDNARGALLADRFGVGAIENTDHMPAAWLARFGRTVTDQVLDAVEERLAAPRRPGAQATLAGQALPSWDGDADATAAANPGSGSGAGAGEAASERALAARDRDAMTAIRDWMAHAGTSGSGASDPWGEGPEDRERSRALTERDFLTGTSFALTGGSAEAGGYAALWGRGAISRFDGREGDLSLDGEVTTGLIGADWAFGPGPRRWTAGLAVGHARGTGSYREGGGCDSNTTGTGDDGDPGASRCSGEVEATLTGVWPYGGLQLTDRLSAWAAAGYGAGEMRLTPGGGSPFTADLTMAMGAAGLRGEVLTPPPGGGLALAVKGDARFTRTASEATRDADGGRLEAAEADVWLVRTGIEGSRRFVLGGDTEGMVLTPSFEIGARLDGGDAETGLGVDLGGGLAFAAPRQGVALDLKGRGLIAHEASGFREWGASAALTWDPRPETDRGLALRLRQSWGGSPTGGMDALLGRETLAGLAANDNGGTASTGRLEAELGYGIAMFDGGFTGTPNLGVGFSETSRDYRVGWRLTSARKGDTGFRIDLDATRREAANAEAEHGLMLRGTVRW